MNKSLNILGLSITGFKWNDDFWEMSAKISDILLCLLSIMVSTLRVYSDKLDQRYSLFFGLVILIILCRRVLLFKGMDDFINQLSPSFQTGWDFWNRKWDILWVWHRCLFLIQFNFTKFWIKMHSSSKTTKEDLLYFVSIIHKIKNVIYNLKQEKFKYSIGRRLKYKIFTICE